MPNIYDVWNITDLMEAFYWVSMEMLLGSGGENLEAEKYSTAWGVPILRIQGVSYVLIGLAVTILGVSSAAGFVLMNFTGKRNIYVRTPFFADDLSEM